jgi:hypothetical protein
MIAYHKIELFGICGNITFILYIRDLLFDVSGKRQTANEVFDFTTLYYNSFYTSFDV